MTFQFDEGTRVLLFHHFIHVNDNLIHKIRTLNIKVSIHFHAELHKSSWLTPKNRDRAYAAFTVYKYSFLLIALNDIH